MAEIPPHDVILDDVPYEEMSDGLLHQLARGGDQEADAELDRRAEERVEQTLQRPVVGPVSP